VFIGVHLWLHFVQPMQMKIPCQFAKNFWRSSTNYTKTNLAVMLES
jgi:hypothetical protein